MAEPKILLPGLDGARHYGLDRCLLNIVTA